MIHEADLLDFGRQVRWSLFLLGRYTHVTLCTRFLFTDNKTTNNNSFDECVIGRDYLFHPATIFSVVEKEPFKYYDMAVTGSKNVLESVLKARELGQPIKKVVATMSLISIFNFCGVAIKCPKVASHYFRSVFNLHIFTHVTFLLQNQQPKNGEYFNEEDWSHTLVPDGGYAYTNQPFEAYGRSKVSNICAPCKLHASHTQHTNTHVDSHTRMHNTRACMPTSIRRYMSMHKIRIYICSTHACMLHMDMHTDIRTHTQHTNAHTYTHVYPCITYEHAHTYMHTYTLVQVDQDKFTREFCIVNKLECATVHPSLIIGSVV